MSALIKLKILQPHRILVENDRVESMMVETNSGYFGILPNRLDCIAYLVPGILTYNVEGKPNYAAIDEGILVKMEDSVIVSIRTGYAGIDLGMLKETVEREFLNLNEKEKEAKHLLTKLETEFVRRYVEYRHEK